MFWFETLYFLAQNNKMIRKMERLILRGSTTSRHICSLETVSFSTENSKKSSSKWSQMGAVTALKLLAWHKFKIKKLELKMKLVPTVPFGLHPESFAWYFSHFVFQVNFFLRQLILWYSVTLVPVPTVTDLPACELKWRDFLKRSNCFGGFFFPPPKVDLRGC